MGPGGVCIHMYIYTLLMPYNMHLISISNSRQHPEKKKVNGQAIESILGINHINEPHEECILLQKNLDPPVHGKIHLHDVQSERCVA